MLTSERWPGVQFRCKLGRLSSPELHTLAPGDAWGMPEDDLIEIIISSMQL